MSHDLDSRHCGGRVNLNVKVMSVKPPLACQWRVESNSLFFFHHDPCQEQQYKNTGENRADETQNEYSYIQHGAIVTQCHFQHTHQCGDWKWPISFISHLGSFYDETRERRACVWMVRDIPTPFEKDGSEDAWWHVHCITRKPCRFFQPVSYYDHGFLRPCHWHHDHAPVPWKARETRSLRVDMLRKIEIQ